MSAGKVEPMQDPVRERMSEIAERFPSLRGRPGVRPWDAITLARWIVSGVSHGEQLAGRFMLGVWNGGDEWPWVGLKRLSIKPFDLFEAKACWDEAHQRAFAVYVAIDWEFCP